MDYSNVCCLTAFVVVVVKFCSDRTGSSTCSKEAMGHSQGFGDHIGEFQSLGKLNTCGVTALSNHPSDDSHPAQLIGGAEAASGSWPWQVRLGVRLPNRQIIWICGGSILSDIYIVTAAHCLESGWDLDYVVRLGEHNTNFLNEGEEDYAVERLRVHERYSKANSYANDIAILRVSKPIRFNNRMAPICLPSPDYDPQPGTACFVTGWGNTGPGKAPFSTVLKEGKVRVIDRSLCQTPAFWGYGVKRTNICAGYPQGKTDACRGDSGGPLVCQEHGSNRWVLQGIVSFGWNKGCGFAGKPAVYTRVSSYLKWIKTVTGS